MFNLENLTSSHGLNNSEYTINGKGGYSYALYDASSICLYEILRLLLSVPYINGLINLDIFKDINESFKIDDIDKRLKKIDKHEISIYDFKKFTKKKIKKQNKKMNSTHHEKLVFMLKNILDAIYKKHGDKEFCIDWDNYTNKFEYVKDFSAYGLDKHGVDDDSFGGFINGMAGWEIVEMNEKKGRIIYLIEKLDVIQLYYIIQQLLDIPEIITIINMDLFKDINEN